MFMRDSFTSTYSGPFLASGETLSRARSQASADRDLAGNQRAYLQRNRGVQAGNKGSVYRAGLLAETQAANAGHMNAANVARAADDAATRMGFQTSMAEEGEGLRRLLFDRDQTMNMSENSLRKDMAYRQVGNERRRADSKLGSMSRETPGLFGWINNLVS